jgi:hypothetical protein
MTPFRSTKRLGWVVSALLAAQVAVALLAGSRFLTEIGLARRVDQGGISLAEVELLDRQLRQVSVTAIVLFFVTAVVWLVWEYLAYRNLESLGTFGTDTSPRGSVGWWFVPFANLVKPFRGVRDLWKGSDPNRFEDWNVIPTWDLIGWWWAMFLGSRVVVNMGLSMRTDATTPSGVANGDRFAIVGELLLATAAVLAIRIVRSVVNRQAGRAVWDGVPPRPDR